MIKGKSLNGKLVAALLFIGGVSFATSSLAFLYEEDFSDGNLSKPTLYRHGACYPHSLNIVDSPSRNGNKSLKVVMRTWEKNEPCNNWSTGKPRTELEHGRGLGSYDNGRGGVYRFLEDQEYWIGYSMLIPKDYPINNGGVILAQIISTQIGPEWDVIIKNGRLRITNTYSTAEVCCSKQYRELYNVPVPLEQWIDIVMNFKRSWRSDGFIKLWINGKLVADVKGPNMFRNALPHLNGLEPYFKHGAYSGATVREEHTVYFDEVRIGSADASYALVAPHDSFAKRPATPVGLTVKRQ